MSASEQKIIARSLSKFLTLFRRVMKAAGIDADIAIVAYTKGAKGEVSVSGTAFRKSDLDCIITALERTLAHLKKQRETNHTVDGQQLH